MSNDLYEIIAPTPQPTTAMPTTAMPTTAKPTTAMPTTAMPTTAQPTSEPTRDCDLLHIDEFLVDCSNEWETRGSTMTTMQSSINANAAEIHNITHSSGIIASLESRVADLEDMLHRMSVHSNARAPGYSMTDAVDDVRMVKGVSNGVTVTGKDLGIVALAAINVIMIVIMVIACKGSGRRTKYQPVAVGSDMEPINA